MRRFASEMQVGDVALLRTGIATITAVGIVASDYIYLNQFDDRERLGPPARQAPPLVQVAAGIHLWDRGLRGQPDALLADLEWRSH